MSTPVTQTHDEASEPSQETIQHNVEPAMMIAKWMKNIKLGISNNLGPRLGAKLFRAVALGALLAAATTMYLSMSQGEAESPSANSETTLAPQTQVYTVPEDPKAAEAPYDALSKNFIGIAASGNESYLAPHAVGLPEIWEEDPEERVYDEMRMSFVGISAPSSVRFDVSHSYVFPEILEEDVHERLYDELRESFIGIPAPNSEAAFTLPPIRGDQ